MFFILNMLACIRNLNEKEIALFNGKLEFYQDRYKFKILEADILYLKIYAKKHLNENEIRSIIAQLPQGLGLFHKMHYWNYANVYDENGIFRWQIGFHSDTTIFDKNPTREFY